MGRFKCNIDALFASHLNRVGIGISICDELGQFVLSKTKWIALLCGVDFGEPLGLMQAEPANALGLIHAGPLLNATMVEPGAAHTYSAAVIWKSPTPALFKCNIDASFAAHLNRVGIGICICNELGQFVL